MSGRSDDGRDVASLLRSQKQYYELRAPDYLDPSRPDRRSMAAMPGELIRSVVDRLQPIGHVLELACGEGAFTRELVRHATSVTAVDGSPTMLSRNHEQVDNPKVRYLEADLFSWRPDRQFDLVFFGFWLSHVPPGAFDDFWALVSTCLGPGGRVAFVDEDDRASERRDTRFVDGVPVARRTLRDGQQFDVVKVFWAPTELERRLRAAGWQVSVRPVGPSFLAGTGRPTR